MEAIIDGIEALVYGNPCEGDRRVDETLVSQVESEENESFEKIRESLRKEFEFTYPEGISLQEQYTHTTQVFRSLDKTIKTLDDYQEGLALKGYYAQLLLEKALEWN